VSNPNQVAERIADLSKAFASDVRSVVYEEHQDGLVKIAERVTKSLQVYVPGASVSLDVVEPAFRPPTASFDLRVSDHDVQTDVTRQGHGFQRALIVATLQELMAVEELDDPPAVFLAIEEPELFQHPTQARHFASVLSRLPRSGDGAIQVAFATHSEHFIDAARYERLRRFRKARSGGVPAAQVASASIDAVSQRLREWMNPEEVQARISIALRRRLSEAVFADAVLLVEGVSDAGVMLGTADRLTGFDALGVSVIGVGGKTVVPLAHAILSELEVPVYTVFDADGGNELRMRERGRAEADILAAKEATSAVNKKLLRLLGGDAVDWPSTQVTPTFAVFADTLEAEIASSWPEVASRVEELSQEAGSRSKSDEWYRAAALSTVSEPPVHFRAICDAVAALRG
jgi:putative ATP-dependent endonuclease of OLD family